MLKLEAGEEISLETEHGKVAAKISGWKEGSYIFVDAADWRLHLKGGDEIICRVLNKGKYLGFSSEALGYIPEIHTAVLKYPSDIIETDIRKSERVRTVMPVKIYRNQKGGASDFEGYITDLSAIGFKLSCDISLKTGDTVYITGTLPTGHQIERLPIVVKRLMQVEKGTQYGVAMDQSASGWQDVTDYLEKVAGYTGLSEDWKHICASGIPLGEPCQAQLGSIAKLNTIFRAVAANKYILIDPPFHNGKPMVAARGELINIIYMMDGTAYKFESQVARQYSSPVPIWAINIPYIVKNKCMRKSARVCSLIPAKAETSDGSFDGVLIDISEGGGCLATSIGGFYKGQNFTMRMTLPTGEQVQGLHCQVRSVGLRDGKTLVGLEFEEIQKSSEEISIKKFCDVCMKAGI